MPITGYDEIKADLKRHRQIFDLTKDRLGRDLCKLASESTGRSFEEQRSPTGEPWPELSDKYEKWKSKNFPGQSIGELYGIMANDDEIKGENQISANEAEYGYGVTVQAIDEMGWFQNGDDQNNRPPREAIGLDDEGVKLSDERCRTHLDRLLKG